MNDVKLSGNLTRDPEMRATPNGTKVVNFGIAVSDSFKNKQSNQWEKKAHFFECVAFGSTAENISKFFGKGRFIIISDAKLQFRAWDAPDGSKRSKVEILVNKFEFGGGAKSGSESQAPQSQGAPPIDPDDIPF